MSQRVVITGAATGIGAECVQILKARGAEVIALDIAAPAGVDRWIKCDLSDPAQATAAAASIDGPIDVLINNAGLPPRDGLAAKVLAVNVFGVIALTEALSSKLARNAVIVTTASRAGSAWRNNIDQVKALLALEGVAELSQFLTKNKIDDTRAYNLSKEAVIVWSQLQIERFLKLGTRINSVSPAPVATGILDDFVKAFGEKAAKALKRVGRAGTPQEIAEVICFVASPEGAWINGQDIVVDGGMAGMIAADAIQSS